jgi:hypothetical protein
MLQTTIYRSAFQPIERGINYAEQLRQSKRTQLLMQKRLKLLSIQSDHHQNSRAVVG